MTTSRLVILPYKIASQSAKKLAEGLSQRLNLKVRRIRPEGNYIPVNSFRSHRLVCNYGSTVDLLNRLQFLPKEQILNHPSVCAVASNKLSSFTIFSRSEIPTVEWTTSREQALQWILSGSVVVCRTILNGHSGSGIFLAFAPDELVGAPLYTRYKKKKKEFRVHVFQGSVIDIAEKRKTRNENHPEGSAALIRSHRNGWVFCRDAIAEPENLRELAIAACKALQLDFGAVDIIWNEHENKCYVLEINTAPGLEGTTRTKYVDAIYSWQRNL